MFQKIQNLIPGRLLKVRRGRFAAALLLIPFIFLSRSLGVEAGNSFVHTHTDDCVSTQTVPCDYPHEKFSSHEIITRHCEYCGTQTSHSHYLTNYRCDKTGYQQTVAGSTACLTCHNAGYCWGADAFLHYRTDAVYVCGAKEAETVASVSLTCSRTEMTNQDIVLSAGVELLNPSLAGESFFYSWDNSTWAGETSRTVSENGTYTVWVKNQKGEIADASVTVTNIDKIAPVINNISHDMNGMTKEKIYVTVSASDENKIAGYSFDGGTTWQEDGGCWIQAGRTYRVTVKDAAGNTAMKEVKRADFPYPYEPPAVSPSPSEPPAAPSTSPKEDTEVSGGGKKPSSDSGKKENGTKKESASLKDAAKEKRKEKEDASAGKEEAGGMVPKITVSRNQLLQDTISGNDMGVSANGVLPDSTGGSSVSGAQTREDMTDTSRTGTAGLGSEGTGTGGAPDGGRGAASAAVLGAGGLLLLGTGGYFFFCFFQSGVLYTMDDTEERPFFRRVQRIRIQKYEKGYKMTLPAYVAQLEGSGHFRILLSKYWLREGRNKQISIYTGKRKLVADMEECIDFVL